MVGVLHSSTMLNMPLTSNRLELSFLGVDWYEPKVGVSSLVCNMLKYHSDENGLIGVVKRRRLWRFSTQHQEYHITCGPYT